jgi:hypothetical protein
MRPWVREVVLWNEDGTPVRDRGRLRLSGSVSFDGSG